MYLLKTCLVKFLAHLKKMFIYFWDRESLCRGGAERRGNRESEAGSVLMADSPMQGSDSGTMRSWPKPKSRVGCLTDWASQEPLLCPFLNRVVLLLLNVRIVFWILDPCRIQDLQVFSHFVGSFHFLNDILWCLKVFNVMKSSLSSFSFAVHVLSVLSKNSLPNPRSWIFSSKSFIRLALTFTYFEFIFVYAVR